MSFQYYSLARFDEGKSYLGRHDDNKASRDSCEITSIASRGGLNWEQLIKANQNKSSAECLELRYKNGNNNFSEFNETAID